MTHKFNNRPYILFWIPLVGIVLMIHATDNFRYSTRYFAGSGWKLWQLMWVYLSFVHALLKLSTV